MCFLELSNEYILATVNDSSVFESLRFYCKFVHTKSNSWVLNWSLKGSIFLKNRHFIQERFNKLIYGINTIIKCGIWQPVKFHLVSLFLNWIKHEMIFYRISELMLATLIQRYHKNHFISRTGDLLKFYKLSGATFYDCINTIYQFIKPFLDNKMSMFEEYGAFKVHC